MEYQKKRLSKKFVVISLCVIAVVLLSATMMGCGAQSFNNELKSKDGVVTLNNYGDFDNAISSTHEEITLYKNKDVKTRNYIIAAGCDSSGKVEGTSSYLKSYKAGQEYTYDQVESDIKTHMTKFPNMLNNPEKVEMCGGEFCKCELTINGENAVDYFGVVSGKPAFITVVGSSLISNDNAQKTVESVKFNY